MTAEQKEVHSQVREQVSELAKPFLVIESQRDDLYPLLPNPRDRSRHDVVRVVRGDRCRTKQAFADEVSAAFQFPQDFFGRSWDAFSEYLNDLDWLPATDHYVLIFTNADQLLLKDPLKDFKMLVDILEKTATNWESGANHDILTRAYRGEVVPKKSRFSVVFHINPNTDLSGNFGQWLSGSGVIKVDV